LTDVARSRRRGSVLAVAVLLAVPGPAFAVAQRAAGPVHVARLDDRALDLVDVRPTLRVRIFGSARCTQSVPVVVRERGDRSHVLLRAKTDARGGLVKHLGRIPNQTILAEARAFRPEQGGFCPHVQDARSPNA